MVYFYVLFAWYSVPLNSCTLALLTKQVTQDLSCPCYVPITLYWLAYWVNIYKCLNNLECCFEFLWTVVDIIIIA